MKKRILFPVLFLLFTSLQGLYAQIQVQVMMQPPYPIHYAEYMFQSDKILVQLTNTGSDTRNVRLLPTLTGDNGVKAYIKPSFIPNQPIQLTGGQSMLFNFRQLKIYHQNLSQQDIALEGTSIETLIRQEKLPEGNYTLCVDVVDFTTGAPLSPPMTGCAFFALTYFDPPVIIQPFDKSEVPITTPQLVHFTWTPTGLPGKTRYRFQITDITQTGLMNPNDAFLAAAIQPFLDRKDLIVPALNYAIADPPLKVNHTYAVRVQAYDPTQGLSFKNNGWGPVSTFTWISPTGVADPTAAPIPGGGRVDIDDLAAAPEGGGSIPPMEDPNDAPGCFVVGAGTVAAPPMGATHTPLLNDEVIIGKFRMKVTEANGAQGKGVIFIAFLNTNIKVLYANMQVNEDGYAVGQSLVWADADTPNFLSDEVLKQFNGNLDNTDIPYEPIKSYVDAHQRKVSSFKGQNGPAVGLPVSLNSPKNDLYFLGIEFTPTQAKANISLGLPFPEAISKAWVNLGLKGVIIRPNGFDLNEGKISLASDQQIALSDKATFVLKAQKTYLTFSCSGVEDVHIDGYFELSRQLAIPVNAQGKAIGGNETLKGLINTTIESATNWVAEATFSHPKFCLPGMEDVQLSAPNLIFDNSGTQNAPGMKFPNNHPKANPVITKTWTGLYMSQAQLALPDWMKGANNSSITINFEHLLLDKTGVWMKVEATNIIALGQGSVGGWGFSIDEAGLTIESSVPAGGTLKGKLRVPITETGLAYQASISKGNPEANFLFSISTLDEVRIDMMVANATFFPNSSVTIEKINGQVKPSAMLHGQLQIGWTENDPNGPKQKNLVSSFSLPTLKFQDMHIFTGNNNLPQLGDFTIQLDNPNNKQGLLTGFPLSLLPPSVSNIDGEVSLQLGLKLTLSSGNSNGLSGSTSFSIIGKYDANKKLFVYDRTQLDEVTLDVDVAVAKISGSIKIYAKDNVYGNGFRGNISATIKGIGIGAEVTLQAGKVNNYDYFYFDGMFRYEAGFTIPGTVAAIYGFGGGFYYNMLRDEVPTYTYAEYASKKSNKEGQIGGSQTGVTFTPTQGEYGFSATVLFGLAGGKASASVFNGDLTFRMALKKFNNGSIGIKEMFIEGNAYAIAQFDKSRNQASIKGYVKIAMDFIEPSFTLDAGLYANIANGIVEGQMTIQMHFSPAEWYVHLGRWDTQNQKAMDEPWTDNLRNKLTVDLKIISATLHSYFMMGSQMPDLPPLPKAVRERMLGQDNKPITDARKEFPSFDPTADNAKPGFGFGIGLHTAIEFKILFFYADITFMLGFDAVLKNYGNSGECGDIGINGWFAKGQAYADINVAAGLVLDIWIWEGKLPLLTFHGTAVLEASLPNPNYFKGQVRIDATALNGLIKVKTNVKFETGKKPSCTENTSPFDDYPIVSEIYPEKDDDIEIYDDFIIVFNFPEGEFPVSNENDPETPPKYYYYKIEKFELKHGNTVYPSKPIAYSKDKYSGKYETYNLLPALSTIKLEMVVKGYEKYNPKALVTETYERTYKTKKFPGKIVGKAVTESRPQPRQRYFLTGTNQDEFTNAEVGFFKFKQSDFCTDLLDKTIDTDPEQFDLDATEFLVQFRDLSNNKKYEVGCYCQFGELRFDVPQNLKPSQIHEFRVIKRLSPKAPKSDKLNQGPSGLSAGLPGGHYNPQNYIKGDGQENGPGNPEPGMWVTGSYENKISEGTYTINKQLLGYNKKKTVDVNLYKAYFRTSQYQTIEQKMQSYKVHAKVNYSDLVFSYPYFIKEQIPLTNSYVYFEGAHPFFEVKIPLILLKGQENFDVYDVYGYTLGNENQGGALTQIKPNVSFEATEPSGNIWPGSWPSRIYTDSMTYAFNKKDVEYDLSPERYSDFSMKNIHVPGESEMKSRDYHPDLFEVYYQSKYGSISDLLPQGTTFRKPDGVLTQAEIDEALANAPEEKEFSFGDMEIKLPPISGKTPPMPPSMDFGANVHATLPIVDLTSTVVALDSKHVINKAWYFTAPSGKDLFYSWIYLRLCNAYKAPSGNYHFYFGGKKFTYSR